MAIKINGNWTISGANRLLWLTDNKNPLDNKIIISGAETGNGEYGIGPTPSSLKLNIPVTGTTWNLNLQYKGLDGLWKDFNIVNTFPSPNALNITAATPASDTGINTFQVGVFLKKTGIVTVPPVIITTGGRPVDVVQISHGQVYTKFTNEDILPPQRIIETYGIWENDLCQVTGNLLTYHTASYTATSSFYKQIEQTDKCFKKKMFTIAYGNDAGSGSKDFGGMDFFTPSNAIYGQYKSLCLNNYEKKFVCGQKEINHFYVINVNRDRMGDRLDDGLSEINLHKLSGSAYMQYNTGSTITLSTNTNIIRLIDDSRLDYESLDNKALSYSYSHIKSTKTKPSNYHYLVSGSLEDGIFNKNNPRVYGLVYPSLGVYILDADVLDSSGSFNTVTLPDFDGDNAMKLFKSMSGSALYTDASGDYLGFKSRKTKYEHQYGYVVRLKNYAYNFTNNPTFVTGSEGVIIDDFNNYHPNTYMTTIGLYNEHYELLAIGKVNKAKLKNYTTEGLYVVKLRY